MYKRIIFSDEKCFSLCGPIQSSYGWSFKHQCHKVIKQHSQGGHVMVWGGICNDNKSPLIFVKGNMKSAEYTEVLMEGLLPILRNDTIFQQDNAPVHVSKVTKQWLDQHNIQILEWPARSPDLNIIENLWAKMSNDIYSGGVQYTTKEHLIKAINFSWNNLEQTFIENMYNSIPMRILQCIECKGGQTDY